MASNYFTLLTKIGQASIANAVALNQKVNLTYVAIGDGNGSPTTPKESQTELVNEVYRAQVNQLTTDPDNPNYLIAEMIVPTNVGGWSVREVGLFDDSENLIAIANFPETYKPKLEEGSGRDLVIRVILQVSNTNAVVLKIDPTIILASQSWVIENFNKKTLFPGGKEQQVLMKLSGIDGDMDWKYLSGVPIGTIEYFATPTPPVGYLKADGAAVGRATYPELFAAIGTTFGAGDGSTTFNVPNLIGRHAKGSLNVGEYTAPGLPNITGYSNASTDSRKALTPTGAFYNAYTVADNLAYSTYANNANQLFVPGIDASRSSPIYGASDTVDVAAVGFLPCIKAFDAYTNPGMVDITELANEMAGKVDRYIDNKPVRYVVDAYNDGTSWYRKWSDDWLEQGGRIATELNGFKNVTLYVPYANADYTLTATGIEHDTSTPISWHAGVGLVTNTGFMISGSGIGYHLYIYWHACGKGA